MSENTKPASACRHMNFDAKVGIARLENVGRFVAEIRIRCTDCDTPFQFRGLEAGCDTDGARVSIDGLEANIAIVPEGAAPNPFQRLAYNVERFDG